MPQNQKGEIILAKENSKPTQGEDMKRTQTEVDRAFKKVEIAIDKMVDLQDMGFGNDAVARILEMLNSLKHDIYND